MGAVDPAKTLQQNPARVVVGYRLWNGSTIFDVTWYYDVAVASANGALSAAHWTRRC